MNASRRLRTTAAAVTLLAAPIALTGCSTAGEGAVSGAGIGALTGLVFGSMVGDAGEGAVLGTAAGAVVGGVIGDQNEREARNAARQADAYRQAEYDRQYYESRRDRDRDPGWGDRYEHRDRSSNPYRNDPYSSSTTYQYERYETRSHSPRVIIRYDSRPSYRYSHKRDDRRRGWNYGFGWSYTDRYCR